MSTYESSITNPKKQLEFYKGLSEQLEKENQELKKQVDGIEGKGTKSANYNQQKEFIKYLEEKLNFYKINTQGYSMNLVEEILQKYKSIIGDDK